MSWAARVKSVEERDELLLQRGIVIVGTLADDA
jgi:hypothetical protein